MLAFGLTTELADVHPAVIAADPVTARVVEDARRRLPGGRILLNRRCLGARLRERNCP